MNIEKPYEKKIELTGPMLWFFSPKHLRRVIRKLQGKDEVEEYAPKTKR